MPRLPAPPLPKVLQPKPRRPGDGNGKLTPAEGAQEAGLTVVGWLDERTSLTGVARWTLFRKVPRGTNWYYTLGTATLFAFLNQAVTGVFLAMYYRPNATDAYESIRHINDNVWLGQFVHGMHKWGASVMIILIFLHMGRVFFFGAYKYPRELTWVIGVVILILVLMMGLTVHRALPRELPNRRRRFRGDDPVAFLCDPHAPDSRADHRLDRLPPVPRREARHDGAAVPEAVQPRRARATNGRMRRA
jgi:Cytochrome b/b6/petB